MVEYNFVIPSQAITINTELVIDLIPYLKEGMALKEIIVRHIAGSLSGGSSGSLNPNTVLKTAKIKLNGKEMFYLTGIECREVAKRFYANSLPNEDYVFKTSTSSRGVPDRNKGTHSFSLSIMNGAISEIQSGDRTTYSGAYYLINLVFDTDIAPSLALYAIEKYTKSTTTVTGQHTFDIISDMQCTDILVVVYDNSTLADSIDGIIRVSVDGHNSYLHETYWYFYQLEWMSEFEGTAVVTGIGFITVNRRFTSLRVEYNVVASPTALETRLLITRLANY